MTGPVGPRGLTVLAIVGISGILLAILGWSQRGTGLVAPAVGGLGGSAPTRTAAAHGWVLLVLAAALIAGIAPRVAAALASVLLLEIVISLAVTGLSDTVLRDLGVLGLALCLTGSKNQRLVLRS